MSDNALTKKDFFDQAPKIQRKVVKVDLSEFGYEKPMFVREMTAQEGDKYDGELFNVGPDGKSPKMDTSNMRAKLIAITACDEIGKKRMFKFDDFKDIGQMNQRLIQKIYKAATEVNDIKIEDLEKNLKEGQNSDSDID